MKKKIIMIISLIAIVLFTGFTAYAYFQNVHKDTHEVSYSVPDNYVLIESIQDFYNEIDLYKDNPNSDFNSEDYTSIKRKTLRLNVDIVLTSDAIITSDCHIDLNGHFIDLKGYKLQIINRFAGTIAIFTSKPSTTPLIKDTKPNEKAYINKILIDTPNAIVVMDDTLVDSNIDITNKYINTDILLNEAMNLIYSNIANTSKNDSYTIVDAISRFNDPAKCTFSNHADNTNSLGCIYTYTDLDLLYHFYNYKDLKISYATSDPNVLSAGGKIKVDEANSKEAILTISLDYNGTKLNKNAYVHAVAKKDYLKASNLVLQQYLEVNYDSKTQMYVFNNAFDLPLSNSYFNTTYDYSLEEVNTVDGKDEITTYKSDMKEYFEPNAGLGLITVKLAKNIKNLNIISKMTINGVESKLDLKLAVNGKTNSVIMDDTSYCLGIVNKLYGNTIVIIGYTNGSYSEQILLKKPDPKQYSKLDPSSPIINTVQNDNDNVYLISPLSADNPLKDTHERLGVNPNSAVKPILGKTATLQIEFTMKENKKKVPISIPIVYEIERAAEGSLNEFDPYHTYFSKQFEDNSVFDIEYSEYMHDYGKGQIKKYCNTFTMPLFYNNEYPTYTLLAYKKTSTGYEYVPSNTQDSLFDIEIRTEANTPGENINNVDISRLDSYYKINTQSVTKIFINLYKIELLDTEYTFVYVPIFSFGGLKEYRMVIPGETKPVKANTLDELNKLVDFNTFNVAAYNYKSDLKIKGIARCTTKENTAVEEFEDLNFYNLIYKKLYSKDPVLNKDFIFTSDLNRSFKENGSLRTGDTINYANFALNLSKTDTTVITSLKGINLLKGVTSLTLNQTEIKKMTGGITAQIGYISQMTNLVALDLSNTGIYDKTGDNNKQPTGTSNDFIIKLNSLTKLEEIYLQNEKDPASDPNNPKPKEIAGKVNQIYEFRGLDKFPSLKYADVRLNVFTVTNNASLPIIGSLLDRIYENIVNGMYGERGAINQTMFATMIALGKEVKTSGKLVLSGETLAIVNALSSLEYQDKIGPNDKMSICYQEYLDGGPDLFNLTKKYTEEKEKSYKIHYTLDSIAFVEDANGFTFQIKYKYSTQTWQYPSWDVAGIAGSYGDPVLATDPIVYSFYYEVERVN